MKDGQSVLKRKMPQSAKSLEATPFHHRGSPTCTRCAPESGFPSSPTYDSTNKTKTKTTKFKTHTDKNKIKKRVLLKVAVLFCVFVCFDVV